MTFETHIETQLQRMNTHAADAGLAILRRRDTAALEEAAARDRLTGAGIDDSLGGLTIAVKACFDVAGWPTTAGSRVLEDTAAATADAPIVAGLRQGGAVVTSQTNMTEFAFGALGLNSYLGTPRTPLDPLRERIAGGSTSGGAVAVALGLADIALGSDTSGSIRIPAAFCGLAGFKPSRGRYPSHGMLFLSPSFDVPGFIARDVNTCMRIDRALTHTTAVLAMPSGLKGRRFLVPDGFALQGADTTVAEGFAEAIACIEAAGGIVVQRPFVDIGRYGAVAVEGGIIIAEAYAWHRPYLESRAELYDVRVGPRIRLGATVTAEAYIKAAQELVRLSAAYHCQLDGFDALLTPTVPIVPPKVEDLQRDEQYFPANRLTFSLTEIANRIDAPSMTLAPDPAKPVGIMLTGKRGDDEALLRLAYAVETEFRS